MCELFTLLYVIAVLVLLFCIAMALMIIGTALRAVYHSQPVRLALQRIWGKW